MRDSRGSSSSTNEAASRASSGACTQFAEVISQDKMKVRQIDPGRVLKQIYACLPFDLHSEWGCNRPFAVAAAGVRLLVERLELDC